MHLSSGRDGSFISGLMTPFKRNDLTGYRACVGDVAAVGGSRLVVAVVVDVI